MKTADRFNAILNWFRANVPVAESELNFSNPWELLVSVILSAQCTDKRVNMVTPAIFQAFPTPADMAAATFDELYALTRTVSYPNSKTRHLIETASILAEKYNGTVPDDIDLLMELPGVGRKTANVVTSIIYNRPVIAVDTHVFRVSHRLGLSKGKTPEAVEKDLEARIPEADRAIAHHWLILHGRYTCTARNPKCEICGLAQWCKDFPQFIKK